MILIAIGLVLLVIPGPGILFMAAGATFLAEESYPVARLLDRLEIRIRRKWVARRRGRPREPARERQVQGRP